MWRDLTFAILLGCALVATRPSLAGVVFSTPITYTDPVGDTFSSTAGVIHDIVSIESQLGGGQVRFGVRFQNPIAAPSDLGSLNNLTGFLDLDVDQNASTGATSQKSLFSPSGASGLGVEYFVDLFSEEFQPGFADIVDTATGFSVGTAAVTFDDTLLDILIDLATIGDDDGAINYGVIVGDFIDVTDEARNAGLPVPRTNAPVTNPEPTTIAVWCVVGVVGGWFGRSRQVRERR